ncbi:hypothetical protein FRC02_000333 [Tulasnella sp. 418]|nr:hypothetical protein FRC02_000333 [Tulasnella sp. 418]
MGGTLWFIAVTAYSRQMRPLFARSNLEDAYLVFSDLLTLYLTKKGESMDSGALFWEASPYVVCDCGSSKCDRPAESEGVTSKLNDDEPRTPSHSFGKRMDTSDSYTSHVLVERMSRRSSKVGRQWRVGEAVLLPSASLFRWWLVC